MRYTDAQSSIIYIASGNCYILGGTTFTSKETSELSLVVNTNSMGTLFLQKVYQSISGSEVSLNSLIIITANYISWLFRTRLSFLQQTWRQKE
jgi:hypothetical protein